MPNQQLANELPKPIITKCQKRRDYSLFKDNIWGVDLADMQLTSKYNKGITYLLCVTDLFSKYACVVPLKERKGVTIVNAFQNILDRQKRKPEKIWVVNFKAVNFVINLLKNGQKTMTKMYSIYNEGKSVVAKRFIRTLKNKVFKHMPAVSKKVYLMLQMILLINTITHSTELLK